MRTQSCTGLAAALSLVLVASCEQRRAGPPTAPTLAVAGEPVGIEAFPWSEPVWLGPVINSPARDWRPRLAPNGLSLYFHSNRGGTYDIWVSHRAGPNCPWQAPVNLGAPVNTPGNDANAEFTPDGRTMFFSSTGHGGFGGSDIFVTHRADPNDDFGWETPVNLGPDVNTADDESDPAYVPTEDGGALYYDVTKGGNPATSDIYRVLVTRDGVTRGPATLVSELSVPGIPDDAPTVRTDGREIIFWSGGAAGTRPGSVGLADLWVSTRRSVNDPWSPPRNLGTPVNSPLAELSASLSPDGRTLFFTVGGVRNGQGLGLQDMWMSTRGPSGDAADGNAAHCGS